MPVLTPRFPLLLRAAVVLLLLAPLAEAQRRATPAPAPPPAVPLNLRVARGAEVEIPLRIYGTRAQTLTFLIRSQPEHGRLSEPRRAGTEAAAVTYTPPADLAITRDRFTYAVKSSEGVSAAVDVTIKIVDLAPELVVPEALKFPQLLIGARAGQPLEITNRGGLPAEGKIVAEAPWQIEGDAEYRLESGQSARFQVYFTPEAAGDFQGELRYSSQLDRVTTLLGIAVAPLAVSPADLILRQTGSDTTRVGAFEIVNNTTEDQTVRLAAVERLLFSRELSVRAGERITVPVQTRASDLAPLEEVIRLEATGELGAQVKIVSAGVAGVLRVPESVSFREASRGGRRSAELLLENTGGKALRAKLQVEAPFTVEREELELAPGSEVRVPLHLPAGRAPLQGVLHVESSAGRRDVALIAEVESAAVNRHLGIRAPSRTVTASNTATASRVQRAAAIEQSESGPGVKMVMPKIVHLNPTECRMVWSASAAQQTQFRAERRQLSLTPERELKIEWQDYSAFSSARDGAEITVTFSGLQPQTSYTMRVRPVGSRAEVGPPVFAITFQTPPARSILPEITLLRGLLLGLLIAGGAVLWQRWRARRSRSL